MMILHDENGTKRFDRELLDYIATGETKKALAMLEEVAPGVLIDSSGKSLLHWCAMKPAENSVIVDYLIGKGCNVDAQDNAGNTPFMLAVEANKSSHTIQALIEFDANLYISNNFGSCPIKHAFSKWGLPHKQVVEFFLSTLYFHEYKNDKQSMVNILRYYKCPSYFVVLLKDAEITRMMLNRGCTVRDRCHLTGDTALHEAVHQSHLENVKLLVERGADIDDLGYEKQTPLQRYDISTEDSYEKLEILKFLIAQGASLTVTEETQTLMEKLMRWGSEETVCAMLQVDAIDLRATNTKGESAIHLVCLNRNLRDSKKAIRMFHGKDFDINAANGEGSTALMIAALNGFVSTVECLLEMGADPNISDNKKHTAILYVTECDGGRDDIIEIVDLLLMYGADAQHVVQFNDSGWTSYYSFLDVFYKNILIRYAEGVLARLAELKFQDSSMITEHTQYRINDEDGFKEYFDDCGKDLEEMKSTRVYRSITLFDLLKENSKKTLLRYVRDEAFLKAYSLIESKKLYEISRYYSFVIEKRINAAKQTVYLQVKAITGICKITGLSNQDVAFEIVDYLDTEDLRRLIRASKI